MKRMLILSLILIVVLLGIAPFGFAIDHKVKVTNQTDYAFCGVTVYYGSILSQDWVESKYMRLDPGQSGSISTGAKCPRFITGGCSDGWYTSYDFGRCTLGPEATTWTSCTLTCWGSDWFLRKNANGSVRLDKE